MTVALPLSLMKSWCEHDESLRKSTANFGLIRLIVYEIISLSLFLSLTYLLDTDFTPTI